MPNRPVLATVGLSLLMLSQVACAKHADFANLRQELREAVRAQRDAQVQAQKRDRALQRRLRALEVKKESDGADERFDLLARRVGRLEERLSRMQGQGQGQGMGDRPAATPLRPSESVGDFPRVSRPAGSSPEHPSEPQAESTLSSLLSITPTSAFNLAYNDYLNGRYDLSIVGFQRFLTDFSSTSLAPKARYWLGASYYQKKDYVRAMKAFERVVHDYPKHDKVASALFKVGLTAVEIGDRVKARTFLKRVIEEYSTSPEATLAKRKLAEIR